MAARAIWKGVFRFGEVEVPVKLYSAVEDRRIHFRLLHDRDLVPLEQVMVNPSTGEAVPYEEVRRGHEVEAGTFVVLDEEELEALEPEKSRDIEAVRFLEAGALSHVWFDRPYWVGPDGDDEPYFALARALGEAGREGIVRWTMRGKEYRGALRARDGWLELATLRATEEVVPASALEPPSGREPEAQELDMARRLVSALAGPFVPEDYDDEYRERVRELIEAKTEGKTIEIEPYRAAEAAEGSLAELLERSVGRAGERKTA